MKEVKPQKNKKKILIISAVAAAIVALVIWLAYFVIPQTIFSGLTNYYMPNYAKDTAMPIEAALIKLGAKKVCENASNGRDVGNNQPHYGAYYQFAVSDEETIKTLETVTKENGYELKSIASNDATVQRWQDLTSRDSAYSDLGAGKVHLVTSVYSDTSNKQLAYCGGKGLVGDETHTILTLNVTLPPFKH